MSIEDPFAEDDTVGMQALTQAVGQRVQIIGDDYLEQVFVLAGKHFPDAKLVYNDFSLEKPAKRDAVVKLVHDFRARGVRIELEHSAAGMLPLVASPMRFSETSLEYRLAPPLLGEHTDEVLSGLLGKSRADFEALRWFVLPSEIRGSGGMRDTKHERPLEHPACLEDFARLAHDALLVEELVALLPHQGLVALRHRHLALLGAPAERLTQHVADVDHADRRSWLAGNLELQRAALVGDLDLDLTVVQFAVTQLVALH